MVCACGVTNPEGARFCRNCGKPLSAVVPATPPGLVAPLNAMPFVPRNSTNVISKLEAVRDQIYQWFLEASDALGVEAMVLKSYPFTPTVTVSYECWKPHDRAAELAERSSVVVTVRPRELHRFEYELDVVITKGQKVRTYRSVVELTAANVREIVEYLLDRGSRYPQFFFKRCRTWPFELWLPSNPLVGLRRDPGIWIALGVAAVVLIIGLLAVGPGVLVIAAFIPALWGAYRAIRLRLGRVYVISTGKPLQEPRNLLRMDSWQTLVNGLSGEAASTKAAVREALADPQYEGASLSDERIWYRGVDGKQEREQLVVTFRRAIAFIQVHPYGRDLYVGWDAHLNCGTWVERLVDLGLDPNTRELCQVNTIQAGWHTPNEYDVADANCLIEWVHAAVTRVVKRILAEHRIDQEIDFQILRGERQGIAGRAAPGAAKPNRFRFRREG